MDCTEKCNQVIINFCGSKADGFECCDNTSLDNGDNSNKVPSIGENGNWFIDGEDTGVSAKGEKGDTGAQGPKGEAGDLNETSLIIRPDLWVVGREYDFGNGLYGRRFKGVISENEKVENEQLLANIGIESRIIECNGSWNSGNYYLPLGDNFDASRQGRWVVIDGPHTGYTKGDFIFKSSSYEIRIDSPYEIWIKYTK